VKRVRIIRRRAKKVICTSHERHRLWTYPTHTNIEDAFAMVQLGKIENVGAYDFTVIWFA
jgi:hypothetical protein